MTFAAQIHESPRRSSGRLQSHAERRPRIVDHHLVLADDAALRVVADGADAQAADVVADVHLAASIIRPAPSSTSRR